jgi:hypothetical protein
MPNGIDPRGSAMVWATARESGSITLMDALCLLTTQTLPLPATANVRGATPTAISPSRKRFTASNTLTESLSWLTTHKLALPLEGAWTAMLLDAVGGDAVGARCTSCRKLRLATEPKSSAAVTVTEKMPGLANAWLIVPEVDHCVSAESSPKLQR